MTPHGEPADRRPALSVNEVLLRNLLGSETLGHRARPGRGGSYLGGLQGDAVSGLRALDARRRGRGRATRPTCWATTIDLRPDRTAVTNTLDERRSDRRHRARE